MPPRSAQTSVEAEFAALVAATKEATPEDLLALAGASDRAAVAGGMTSELACAVAAFAGDTTRGPQKLAEWRANLLKALADGNSSEVQRLVDLVDPVGSVTTPASTSNTVRAETKAASKVLTEIDLNLACANHIDNIIASFAPTPPHSSHATDTLSHTRLAVHNAVAKTDQITAKEKLSNVKELSADTRCLDLLPADSVLAALPNNAAKTQYAAKCCEREAELLLELPLLAPGEYRDPGAVVAACAAVRTCVAGWEKRVAQYGGGDRQKTCGTDAYRNIVKLLAPVVAALALVGNNDAVLAKAVKELSAALATLSARNQPAHVHDMKAFDLCVAPLLAKDDCTVIHSDADLAAAAAAAAAPYLASAWARKNIIKRSTPVEAPPALTTACIVDTAPCGAPYPPTLIAPPAQGTVWVWETASLARPVDRARISCGAHRRLELPGTWSQMKIGEVGDALHVEIAVTGNDAAWFGDYVPASHATVNEDAAKLQLMVAPNVEVLAGDSVFSAAQEAQVIEIDRPAVDATPLNVHMRVAGATSVDAPVCLVDPVSHDLTLRPLFPPTALAPGAEFTPAAALALTCAGYLCPTSLVVPCITSATATIEYDAPDIPPTVVELSVAGAGEGAGWVVLAGSVCTVALADVVSCVLRATVSVTETTSRGTVQRAITADNYVEASYHASALNSLPCIAGEDAAGLHVRMSDGSLVPPPLHPLLPTLSYRLGRGTVPVQVPASGDVVVKQPANGTSAAKFFSDVSCGLHPVSREPVVRLLGQVLEILLPAPAAAAAGCPAEHVFLHARGQTHSVAELAKTSGAVVEFRGDTTHSLVVLIDAVRASFGISEHNITTQLRRIYVFSWPFNIDTDAADECPFNQFVAPTSTTFTATATRQDALPRTSLPHTTNLSALPITATRQIRRPDTVTHGTGPMLPPTLLAAAVARGTVAPHPVAPTPRIAAVPAPRGFAETEKRAELDTVMQDSVERDYEVAEACGAGPRGRRAPRSAFGGAGAQAPTSANDLSTVALMRRNKSTFGPTDGRNLGIWVCGGIVGTAFTTTTTSDGTSSILPPPLDAPAAQARRNQTLRAIVDVKYGAGGHSAASVLAAEGHRGLTTGVIDVLTGASPTTSLAAHAELETLAALAVLAPEALRSDSVFRAALAGVVNPNMVHEFALWQVWGDTSARDRAANRLLEPASLAGDDATYCPTEVLICALAAASSLRTAPSAPLGRALAALLTADLAAHPLASLSVDRLIEALTNAQPMEAGEMPHEHADFADYEVAPAPGPPPPPPAPHAPRMMMMNAMAAPGMAAAMPMMTKAVAMPMMAPRMMARSAPKPAPRPAPRPAPALRPTLFAEAGWANRLTSLRISLPAFSSAAVAAVLAGSLPDIRCMLGLAIDSPLAYLLAVAATAMPTFHASHTVDLVPRLSAPAEGCVLAARLAPATRNFRPPTGRAIGERAGVVAVLAGVPYSLQITAECDGPAVLLVDPPAGTRPCAVADTAGRLTKPFVDRININNTLYFPQEFAGTQQSILMSVVASGTLVADSVVVVNVVDFIAPTDQSRLCAGTTGATAVDAISALAAACNFDQEAATAGALAASIAGPAPTHGPLAQELMLFSGSRHALALAASAVEPGSELAHRTASAVVGLSAVGRVMPVAGFAQLADVAPEEVEALVNRRCFGSGERLAVQMPSSVRRLCLAYLLGGLPAGAPVASLWSVYYGMVGAAQHCLSDAPKATLESPMGAYLRFYVSSPADREHLRQEYSQLVAGAGPAGQRCTPQLPSLASVESIIGDHAAVAGAEAVPARYWPLDAPTVAYNADLVAAVASRAPVPLHMMQLIKPTKVAPEGLHVELVNGVAKIVGAGKSTRVIANPRTGYGVVARGDQPAGLHVVVVWLKQNDKLTLHKELCTDERGFFEYFAVTGCAVTGGSFIITAFSTDTMELAAPAEVFVEK